MTLLVWKRLGSAALLAGVALAAGTPVWNARAAEPKAAEAKAPKLSNPVRKALVDSQKLEKEGKIPEALAKLAEVEGSLSTPDDKLFFGWSRFRLASAAKDSALQSKSLESIYNSGAADAETMQKVATQLRAIAYNSKDFPGTIRWTQEMIRLNPNDFDSYKVLAQLYGEQGDDKASLATYRQLIKAQQSAGQKSEEAVYGSVVNAAQKLNSPDEITAASVDLVKAYPKPGNIRAVCSFFRDRSGVNPFLMLASYRLQWSAQALEGAREYLEMADLTDQRGMFAETLAVVQQGTATNQFTGNAAAMTKGLVSDNSAKVKADVATLAAQEKQARAAATGDSAIVLGEYYIGLDKPAQAIELINLGISKGVSGKLKKLPSVNEARMLLAIAQVRAGQTDAARATFNQVTGANDKALVALWLAWLDSKAA